MNELLRSFLPLQDGSKRSDEIVASLEVMDARHELIKQLAIATQNNNVVRANEIRQQLFGTK